MAENVEKRNVLELLQLYHSLPALWDVSSDDYSNRSIKEHQYEILLQKYRETNPYADKKELTKKINTLRTNYRREVKRLREAEKSGVGVNDCFEPTLYYFDALNFLSDVESPASSKITFKVGKGPERKKKKTICSTDELVHLATERLKRPPDTFQLMGSVWGHKLSTMDRNQRVIAEKLINDVMFNAELGLLNYDTGLINVGSISDMSSPTPQCITMTMKAEERQY